MGACRRLLKGEGRALAVLVAVMVALVVAWPTVARADGGSKGVGAVGIWVWTLDADGTLTISGQDIQSAPDKLGGWNASEVKKVVFEEGSKAGAALWNLFEGCTSLTEVDWNGLDTSQVESMGSLFYGCVSLRSVDLPGLDTSSVTIMNSMFWGCGSLESVTFGGRFNTSQVKDMAAMFYGCGSLESLDLSSFDTRSVTEMHNLFAGCKSLSSVTLGENFVWHNGSTNPVLPEPADGLTWVRVDSASGLPAAGDKGYTPAELAAAYPATAEPGTYVWNDFVTVRFDGNGEGVTGQMEPWVLRADENKRLETPTLARPGYEFAGWSAKADGTGTLLSAGDLLPADALKGSAGGTLMLYAQWKELPVDPTDPVDPADPVDPMEPSGPETPDPEVPPTKPADAATSTTSAEAIPQTGDATSSVLPAALCAAGLALVAAVALVRVCSNR